MGKPATQAISFRIRKTRAKALTRLAKNTERSRSWHIERAVEDYLEIQAWQLKQIELGLADVEAGRTIPHEEIVKEFLHPRRKKQTKKVRA